MLKLRIALIAILIACVTFVSCNRTQKVLDPVAGEMMAADDMMDMMMDMMDSTMYMSWEHVMLPAPAMTVAEAAAAMNPGGTGAAHGEGTRTAYINDIGVMANTAGTTYPAGTVIVKTIMDDANTFVAKKAVMTKTDDPMYADHGGWMYVKYARASETNEYMMVGGGSLENSVGCHGCHAKADNDSVFVSLSMDDTVDDAMTHDMMIDDGMTDAMTDMMADMMTDVETHQSWTHVTLPEPVGTGVAHGMGSRTVYFNDSSATANMEGTAYPAGSMIVKEAMDETNTFVKQVVTMVKTDDAMYAEHNGWIYGATQRDSEMDELMTPQSIPVAMAQGCHDCHAKAENDSVFVSLSMDDMADDMMDDGMMDDGMDNGADDGNGAGDAQ